MSRHPISLCEEDGFYKILYCFLYCVRHDIIITSSDACKLGHEDIASYTHLTSETVKGLALTLQSIDNIHGNDSLAASVFRVGDRVADDVLEEHLEDSTSLLVNETRDTLHTTTTSETTDSRLGDSLNVIAENLAVTLGSSLSESFTSFSAARHD